MEAIDLLQPEDFESEVTPEEAEAGVKLSKLAAAKLFEDELRDHRRGTHTMIPPRDEGLYPVWAREGAFRGYVEVVHEERYGRMRVVYYHRGRAAVKASEVHTGWWWSKPLPPMPGAPDWEDRMRQLEAIGG